jgi:hypothetical protein
VKTNKKGVIMSKLYIGEPLGARIKRLEAQVAALEKKK